MGPLLQKKWAQITEPVFFDEAIILHPLLLKRFFPQHGMTAWLQCQMTDEIACFLQGNIFPGTIVFVYAEGMFRADFTAGQVYVFVVFPVTEDETG